MDVKREVIHYNCVRHINIGVNKACFIDPHMHDSFELSCILEGNGYFLQGKQTIEVKPGDLLFSNPYEVHSYGSLPDKPMTILTMQINVRFLRRYIDYIPRLNFNSSQITQLSPEDREAVQKHFFRTAIAYLVHDDYQQFNVIGEAVLLLGKLVRLLDWELEKDCDDADKEFSNNRARRLSDYIDENYRQKITLSTLAEMEGISPTYLSHFFRKAFGISFQQYISARRLEKALILMRDKNVSMVDICMNCGFSDSRYLEAACQRMFGCSVSEYRKQLESGKGFGANTGTEETCIGLSREESLNAVEQYLGEQMFHKLSRLYE